MGDLSQALAYARQSVELTDRSGDSFERMGSRSRLANALHQAGRLSEAEAAFREAEELQKERQPQFPLLYLFQGFLYCDLLLSQGKYQDVQTRAGAFSQWCLPSDSLLGVALESLSLGRAYMLQAQQEGTGDFAQAFAHLRQAVDGLRQAGAQEFIARGLLARAELHRVTGDLQRGQADPDEAMSIAARGSMGLHQADCHLEYACLYLAQGEKDKARQSLAKAKEMIDRMGYHLRDKEVLEMCNKSQRARV